jgi:hypothetical protein
VACLAVKSVYLPPRKLLISLNFLSCPLDVQFVGRLDFQGFQSIEVKFSTKLSTDFLGHPQNAEKSTTYIPFQEFS